MALVPAPQKGQQAVPRLIWFADHYRCALSNRATDYNCALHRSAPQLMMEFAEALPQFFADIATPCMSED